MRTDLPILTFVYRPDDFDPDYVSEAQPEAMESYGAYAERAGFMFRMVPVNELQPTCVDRPRLWWRGEDLLATRQCFQIDDFSWDPQASHFLAAVRRTIEASDSVLLNDSFTGPPHLVTDKLSIAQRATMLGIPAVGTIAIPFGRYARRVVDVAREAFGDGPYILKPRELGMGFCVVKADSVEQLAATVDLVGQSGIGYVVQPFVPNEGDLRVHVINGEIVAGQHRRPKAGNYLANVAQGGSATAEVVTESVRKLSKLVADDLKASLLWVDWLLTSDGPVLSEWSTGFGGFTGLPEREREQVGKHVFAWVHQLLAAEAGPVS